MKKLFLILPIILSACGGVSDRRITDSNIFDYIEAVETSASENDNIFFAPKNKKDVVGCIPLEKDECYKKYIQLGDRLNIKKYEVSVRGGHFEMNRPDDKLLIAAAMVAVQDGFNFITPISRWEQGSLSTTPVAYTSGGNGFYTTSVYNNTRYYENHSLTFIAYNDYAYIKNGVLVERSDEVGTGSLYSDLYRGENDSLQWNAQHGYKEYQGGSYLYTHIADAYKTTYNAVEMVHGENMQNKVGMFHIKRYRPSNYTSVSEKYKK